MTLVPSAFKKIESGRKTIELRLGDEKRSLVSVGDTIVFTNTENANDILNTKVIALHPFASFAELYSILPLEKCGYSKEELALASPDDMLAYYPREKELKYGALGIELELIK